MIENKKILVLGATGTVGAYTSLLLKELGYDVVAVGRRVSDNGFFATKDIAYQSLDLCNKQDFESLPRDVYAVVHLAGAMPARMKGYNPYAYVDSIITGTLNVLEDMKEIGCKKIVFGQSISDILYKFGSTTPINDDIEIRFPRTGDHSVYSISKNAAVNLIEHYHATYGIQRFILRLPTIYLWHPDPYYYVNGEKRWLAYRYIINQAILGKTLEIWGNPKALKEMVYVRDLAQLIANCVECDCDGGIYNVGCGNPVSIEYQVQQIARIFARDKQSDIVYRLDKPSSPQFVLDISKAERDLNYHPQYDFVAMMDDFKKEMELEPFAQMWGRKEDYYE